MQRREAPVALGRSVRIDEQVATQLLQFARVQPSERFAAAVETEVLREVKPVRCESRLAVPVSHVMQHVDAPVPRNSKQYVCGKGHGEWLAREWCGCRCPDENVKSVRCGGR